MWDLIFDFAILCIWLRFDFLILRFFARSCALYVSFLHKIAVGEKDTTSYRRKEISEYSSTSFYIGEDITQNNIKAKYENGILSLMIPKFQPRITEKSYIAIE